MRILHLCAYLYPALTYGGPAKVVYDLAKEQSKKNNVGIITSDVWDEKRRITVQEKLTPSTSFVIHYFKNIVNSWAYSIRLFSHFSSILFFLRTYKRFDIVHAHDVFILPQLFILFLCRVINIPYIVTPHGVINAERLKKKSLLKSIFLIISLPLLKNAKKVIAVSKVEQTELEELGLTNVTTIFNGVPLETHKPSKKFSQYNNTKKLTFLYIGKLHSQKGLLEAIEALSKVSYSFQFLIAGPDDGVEKTLRSLVKKHKLENSVHFLGYVNDSQKSELFSLADLFLYPSYSEGFSISILESLYSAAPVLITDGCNFDLVGTTKSGFVVQNNNLKGNLLTVLRKQKDNKNGLKKMGIAGKKLVTKQFSITTMAIEHQKIYEAYI